MAYSLDSLRNSFQRTVHRHLGYRKFNTDTYILILSVVIGIGGGYGAIGFRKLIALFQYLSLGKTGDQIGSVLAAMPWYWKVVIPMIGGALVGPMIYFFAREAKGHGVPEVMEAVALRGGVIRPRVVVVKSLASALTIGTGGSVGREGPIVQIGSALGSTLGQLLGVTGQRLRVLVGCGASAGIAATFNAPIAGVFFSVEIILGNYAIATLSPLIISSVLATVISRPHLGNVPAFEIPSHLMVHGSEILFYAALGALAGAAAVVFTKTLYAIEDIFAQVKLPEYTKGVIGGAMIGAGLLCFPQIYGVGYQTITTLLKSEATLGVACLLVGVKILATSVTIGSGGSGGIFAPSLFIGSALAGAFGMMLKEFFPTITASPGAYAVAGMGAVVAGTTRGPITAILIIFEMTGDYKIILPIMTACIISGLVATKLSKESIYTLKLTRRGVQLDEGMEVSIMRGARVRDVIEEAVSIVPPDATFSAILNRTLKQRLLNHYVVDDASSLRGVISFHDVKRVMDRPNLDLLLIADDMADASVPNASPDQVLADALDMLISRNAEELPVVDDHNRFLGVVSRHAILNFYQREILKKEAHGLKIVHRDDHVQGVDYIEVGDGQSVKILPASPKMVGSSLAELQIRKNHNVNVVSIRSATTGEAIAASDPDRIITHDDLLVVAGQEDDIERMKKDFDIKVQPMRSFDKFRE